ncbi:MAG: FeS assembly protein SufD [archaeon GW2011_AR11]|nr:MAG: FeS assembly protein SufD [archaeon GW2011_AR11]
MAIGQRQTEAMALYEQLPMPHERQEEWRHTRIDRFDIGKFLPFSAPGIALSGLSGEMRRKGVLFCSMGTALEQHAGMLAQHYLKNVKLDKLNALNAATWKDGIFLYVPKGAKLEAPLSAAVSCGKSVSLHSIIIVDEGAEASYMEEFSAAAGAENETMASCVTEVFVREGGTLHFHHLSSLREKANAFTTIIGDAGEHAAINWNWGCFSGALNRLRIDTLFTGIGSASTSNGVFIGRGKEHIDATTNAYHLTTGTTNDISVNGIMKGSSTAIYRGLIKIAKEAQQTNSFLSNHILKLSENATANSIPALQIDANDVKASHGATIGEIDAEQLFYLMSRGLSERESEHLIVDGFLEPIILKMHPGLRERFRKAVREAA